MENKPGYEQRLEAARCAQAFLNDYRGSERELLPFQMFQALANLTVTSLEQEKETTTDQAAVFDNLQITKAASLRVAEGNPEELASQFGKLWNNLEKLIEELQAGLEQYATEQGYRYLPVLRKKPGGGRGHRSRHWIEARRNEPDKLPEVPAGGLRYRPERRRPAWWHGLFHVGVPLRGLRRWIALTVYLAIAIPILLLALGPLIIRPFIPITWSWLSTLQILVGGGLLLYVLFGPLITVRVWRVAPLPMWLEPWGENEPLLLEAVRIKEPQAKEYNTVEIAKYTGTCPVCGGRVIVSSGYLRFWGRLVGRCQDSPREHVFSFDHITRVGHLL